ncbi:hypothetical protein B0J18DRAFT_491844 [Chaetomium sp. MPI-SDFR-AT-0129]|nr:hypothetical protein B0J18DRAFT_491844 [Chaetomium sp. MPI-SDFR-AT-0129]
MVGSTHKGVDPSTAHGAAGAPRPENTLDDASSVDDGVNEKAQAAPLTKGQKVKAHFKRWWWVHAIVAAVLLIILLPILFKVIIPAIIKSIVDKQDLPITTGALNFTEPDRLHITLDTSLDTPLPVNIDSLPLAMYEPPSNTTGDDGPANPFLTLQMPGSYINHATNITIPDRITDITDKPQLIRWFNKFFDEPELQLRIKAHDMSLHLGSLHYTVDMDKTIRVPGLNYLKGFGVVDMSFTIPPPASGYNMNGHLTIPNAGVVGLGMGNVSFNILAGDINLGLVHIDNLYLAPGNNTPPFYGEFYFDQLVPNLSAILKTQEAALADGMLELHTSGNSTFYNGKRIAYSEGVLNNKRIPFRVPVTSLLLDVLSGVLQGGGDHGQTKLPILDTLGDVLGNKTLFENMLDHFGKEVVDAANGGGDKGKRAVSMTGMGKKVGRSMKMNLLRLGLRSWKAKV